ncbi:MAG TPA: hypothetical protein VHM65_03495 [Candidatus Lustribacter sp.]|nr:hypothetical protein [Candidatus Lustribacter sp.]
MDDRVEVLGADRRRHDEAHAFVCRWHVRRVVRATVHGDINPTIDEPFAQLLDVVLDAAKGGRQSLLPDHRDVYAN